MSHSKSFHRNYRAIKDGPNSGYSEWAYIRDKQYANSPAHYVRAFMLVQSDLQELFEYIEPSPEGVSAYSYRIHELLMRTCIEVEANFEALSNENIFTMTQSSSLNINYYKKVNTTHHLSSYKVMLPIWNGPQRIWKPFQAWNGAGGLPWYQAYNASKVITHPLAIGPKA